MNPAGHDLSDAQKSLYCAMPLEFRVCNTVVLLTVDGAKVDERYQGYLDCQSKVDAAFGHEGLFHFSDDVNQMYRRLFLEKETLSASDTAAFVARNRPPSSGHWFATILLSITRSLAAEAADLAAAALTSMVDDVKTVSGEDPR